MTTEKRLIDAIALKKYMCFKCNDEYSDEPCEPSDCVFYNAIKNATTVDAVEVVHGRWNKETDMDEDWGEMDYYKCSVCGKCQFGETNYCPNCGAKMDGDGNG